MTPSRRTGDDLRIAIDRRFLARAAAMRLGTIHLFGPTEKLVARDDNRQYLWMPLNLESVIPAAEDCLRIESLPAAPPAASQSHPVPPETVPMTTSPTEPTPVTAPETNTLGPSQPVRRRRTSKAGVSPLDQALAVREQLRGALTGTKELIRALKTEKRSQKSLKLALDSLKQLQAAA